MKKLIGIALAATMALSLTACSSKSENKDSAKDNKEQETLIVATEAGFAPYEYMKGNEVVGVDMDICKAIADELDMKLEIKNMDFNGALAAVQSGKVDLAAAGISVTDERKAQMDFTKDYVDNTEVIVYNKERKDFSPAKVGEVSGADLKDKIVAVQQGNIADIWASNKDNAQPKEVKRYAKFAQAAEDLKNGKVDCIVMDQYPAKELVAGHDNLAIADGVLFEDKYAIALKKGNSELLDKINPIIEKLIKDGKIEEFTANHAK